MFGGQWRAVLGDDLYRAFAGDKKNPLPTMAKRPRTVLPQLNLLTSSPTFILHKPTKHRP
jgi:hypothetical protein